MSETPQMVNSYATLRIVAEVRVLVEKLKGAPQHMPRIGGFQGTPGLGKSMASIYAANATNAVYVECRDGWTRKYFLTSVLREAGARTIARSIPEMTEQVGEILGGSRRMLIVDEADKVLDKGYGETIRDIYEIARQPMLLVGENKLESKCRKIERLHGRILKWVDAVPCDLSDAQKLAALYCRKVRVSDDLLSNLVTAVGGSARRICVNLDDVQEHALTMGLDEIDAAAWGDRPFNTGWTERRR